VRVASIGHAVFAATMIVLGAMGAVKGNFAPIWLGAPKGLPAREVLAYLCDVLTLVCGVGLLWRRAAAAASRLLFVSLLLWMLVFKGRFIILAPLVEGSYQSCGENAVIVAAAWVLFAWFATDWDKKHLDFAVGDKGVRIARILYGLALIAFGLSHFFYVELTTPLVPDWLPAHLFWAYFTGCTYLAAGAAMLTGIWARWAAVLSAWQIGGFTVLVWIPILAAGHISAQHWVEFVVSWTLTASAWVMADSYRGVRLITSAEARAASLQAL
jgi:uncharacterized membrane protein